ncbi:A/G-specific adenine glycosylase [Roseomonas eburnea]|uniref:Adenine DNA glycosylase n=1 Tax=Neoroseomonas eburnea TaxID=1346889 RepID=A0A9X9X7E2_9PROT|nr:A/G-specific adenine glycosylase [Neoroseomonas eburnea]MBR0679628.1 A/G-specific adenine glycosylase [Neoroseomonas eburnea]
MTPSAAELLAWYDRHRRVLPWRAAPGEARDPYRVWLSEVMLQQTTVAAVGPRYARFLARFPTVGALAAADWAEVAEEWAGLGYYARARNLHACAQAVAAAGGFPGEREGLAALPGIGPYTASAVAAIAFDAPVVPVDGNVERVTARLHAVEEPLPAAKPRLTALAAGFMADPAARARPGDFAQALFDLGATVCTPRNPACGLCPWRGPCVARRAGIAETLPRKAPRRARPLRHGAHFLLRDAAGRLLLRRRPAKGLLGGMLEVPGTPWRDAPWAEAEALPHAPLAAPWRRLPGIARHGFTHFELEMVLYLAALSPRAAAPDGEWLAAPDAARALPSVMRRLLALVPADSPPR